MNRPVLFAGLALLATVSVGAAFAATDTLRPSSGPAAEQGTAVETSADRVHTAEVGDQDRRYRHGQGRHDGDGAGRHDRDRHHDRRHDRDRDGSCDRDDRGRTARPGNPDAPAPDNGLFGGKTRPKVEMN